MPLAARASLVAGLLLMAAPPVLGARYDPAFRFRTIATPHFRVHFHQGGEEQARRLAAIAERIHADLTRRLATSPSGPTHVILADQQDVANGWATPIPFNTIELAAAWPAPASSIGNTADWLEMAFAHEYTHILQLDRSAGYARILRRTLGRTPLAMPNLFLPAWQIEGLPTLVESEVSGRGRIADRQFAGLVDLPLWSGHAPPLDRVSGGLVAWPSGHAPYAFGGYFHDYLARRFGVERVADLYRRTSGRPYYLSAGAFEGAFGEPVEQAWRAFLAGRPGPPPAEPAGARQARRLTDDGFLASAPRVVGSEVAYASQGPHRFPSINEVPLSGQSAPRRLADAGGARGVAVAGAGRFLLFDRLEWRANVGTVSDLYVSNRQGEVRRLTRGMRLAQPDVAPDGGLLAASRTVDGNRRIVVHRLTADATGWPVIESDPIADIGDASAQYGWPRFSPDGRWLAAERQWLAGPSEIVLVEVGTGRTTTLVSASGSRVAGPSWMPDGRTLLYAADEDGAFGLRAAALERGDGGLPTRVRIFEVARPIGGARAPAATSDGSAIVYVGATERGDDLFVLPVERTTWRAVGTADSMPGDSSMSRPEAAQLADADLGGSPQGASGVPPPSTALDATPYRARSTLWPTSWTPLADASDRRLRVGAEVGAADALGYHDWRASVLWTAAGPTTPGAGLARPSDWRLAYAYTRWTPSFYGTVERESALIRVADAGGRLSDLRREEDSGTLGVVLPRYRMHLRQVWRVEAGASRRRPDSLDLAGRRAGTLRASWVLSSAHAYGYSISLEDGVTAAMASERTVGAGGAHGAADKVTAEARCYLPAGRRHVVFAARIAGGRSWGAAGIRRDFLIGGSARAASPGGFSTDGLNLLRGSQVIWQAGPKAVVANLDLRWPIARIERGVGAIPLFVQSVHGALFADAAEAWTKRFDDERLLRSVGAELSADVVAGFALPLTVTAGVAWTRLPSGPAPSASRAFFVRLGRAF